MERGFDERGQMAVELAVVLPVVLIVLVIAIDCAVYLGECARFDHLAAQSVLASATSPSRDSYDASARAQAVQAELSESFAEHDETVSVSSRDAGMPLASMAIFEAKLEFSPWPFDTGSAGALGYRIPARFTHTYALAIDPYTPGELL